MKTIYKIVLVLLIFSVVQCKKDKFGIDMSKFTYKGKFVFNNQIKMDGYFYRCIGLNDYCIAYFYKDGILYAGGDTNININTTECILINPKERNIPYGWGFFVIENNILKYQTFLDSGGLFSDPEPDEFWAEIVNDSTLHFYKHITTNKDVLDMNDTYHFKTCENKPDSMNILMTY